MTSQTESVAAIASGSLAAVRVLEKHGIDYCTDADRALDDVCEAQGVDASQIFSELQAAATGREESRDWTSAPVRELMDYLVRVDHTFFRGELEVLERRLSLVVATYRDRHPGLAHVPTILRNLATELEAHMLGEERELFPAIGRYLDAIDAGEPLRGSPLAAFGGPLHLMEQEHESTGAALRLMREFCRNYNVPSETDLRYRALIDGLSELELRLAKHMYVENTVLYPRAAALKSVQRGRI